MRYGESRFILFIVSSTCFVIYDRKQKSARKKSSRPTEEALAILMESGNESEEKADMSSDE